MLRETLVALVLMLGLTHTAAQHRKRATGHFGHALWGDMYIRSKDMFHRPRQRSEIVAPHHSSFKELHKDIERLTRMRKSSNNSGSGSWLRKLVLMRALMNQPVIQKRLELNCDTTRITIQIILEYLRSGRICGFRVTTVRFGLGGRR